jgi:hypothetical protein
MAKYWFKAKTWGYGWYPVTWQAWLVLFIWLVILIFGIIKMDHEWLKNLIIILIATGLLVYISWKTGEPAKWRWNK